MTLADGDLAKRVKVISQLQVLAIDHYASFKSQQWQFMTQKKSPKLRHVDEMLYKKQQVPPVVRKESAFRRDSFVKYTALLPCDIRSSDK